MMIETVDIEPEPKPMDAPAVIHDRFRRGMLLGDLVRKYGAKATVDSLGGGYIFHVIGPDEDEGND